MILGADSNLLVQFVLGGFGISGVVGAVIAIYKLRPDVNSAAVVQAQGTMEMMHSLLTAQRTEIEGMRKEAVIQEAKFREQEALIRQLRDIIHGAAMWDDEDDQSRNA